MNELSSVLRDATAAIEYGYFELPIAEGNPVFRERVYCYELYHQMRAHWPPETPFKLNGELDKQGHPILRELGASGAKPDFLVHTPGDMDGNYAIIEVKHSSSLRGIRKDLRTLEQFATRVRYRRAIYLFYGWHDPTEIASRVQTIGRKLRLDTPIEIWLHSDVGQPANQLALLSSSG